MSQLQLKYLLAGATMLAAAAGAVALKPTERMAEQRPINLERMIPQQFGDWKLDQSIAPVQVDPEVQAKLDKIYSQVLSRTYINGKGERVMLSIAYGGDQSDAMRAHRPDVCYPSQGFRILSQSKDVLSIAGVYQLPVRRLVTSRGFRTEPVSYWLMVGTKPGVGSFEQKLNQLSYGLNGTVPDGSIIRVSTVSEDTANGFGTQNRFIADLAKSVIAGDRPRLFGS